MTHFYQEQSRKDSEILNESICICISVRSIRRPCKQYDCRNYYHRYYRVDKRLCGEIGRDKLSLYKVGSYIAI